MKKAILFSLILSLIHISTALSSVSPQDVEKVALPCAYAGLAVFSVAVCPAIACGNVTCQNVAASGAGVALNCACIADIVIERQQVERARQRLADKSATAQMKRQ